MPNGLFSARVKRILGPFINGLFYPYFQPLNMTTADFVAACFWPLVILFSVLLNTVRDPVPLRWIGAITGPLIALCAYCGWPMGLGREPINLPDGRLVRSAVPQ